MGRLESTLYWVTRVSTLIHRNYLTWEIHNMGIMNDRIREVCKLVASADHALSLGYKVCLLTDSRFVTEGNRAPTDLVLECLDEDKDCSAMHMVWHQPEKLVLIVIRDDAAPTTVRFIELVTHEISHAVDNFFERACLSLVDTELRAYHLDWLVGKTLHLTALNDVSSPEAPV